MAVCALLALAIAPLNACNGLFYYPDNDLYSRPSSYPMKIEEVTFASADGTQLSGWFLHAQSPAKATVLHFHGNAGNLTSHVRFVSWLPEQGFNVMVWDYRGYGASQGSASRSGIHEDGLAALAYVRARPDVDASRIIVMGQSLGGAVALDTVINSDRKGIACVVVDSTFGSYQDMANARLGGTFLTMPITWLLIGEAHSPSDRVSEIAPTPLLVIHGTEDFVVPAELGQELFEAAAEPKELWEIKDGRHTDAFGGRGAEYRPKLVEYLEKCVGAGR